MRGSWLVCAVLLGGCVAMDPEEALRRFEETAPTKGLASAGAESTFAVPSAPVARLRRAPYRIGPGDRIRIDVFENPEFSSEHTVGPDGRITLRLHGVLRAEGKERSELASEVADILSRDFVDPQVTVDVLEYRNNRFYILGEVARPGAYPVDAAPTLLDAFVAAGNVREDTADLRRLSVVRGANNVIRIDLQDLLVRGQAGLNIEIDPGDVIYVPRNTDRVVYILGEVNTPGIYPIPLGARMHLVEAILMAGSWKEGAAKGSIYVLRGDREDPRILKVDLGAVLAGRGRENVPLEPGDVVYVPRNLLADVNYVIRQITPAISSIFLAEQVSQVTTGRGLAPGN